MKYEIITIELLNLESFLKENYDTNFFIVSLIKNTKLSSLRYL